MPIFNWFKKKKNAETAEAEIMQAVQTEGSKETAGAPAEEAEIAVKEAVLNADDVLDSEPEAHLTDMDFSDFWHDIKESERRYEAARPDLRLIRSIRALGQLGLLGRKLHGESQACVGTAFLAVRLG